MNRALLSFMLAYGLTLNIPVFSQSGNPATDSLITNAQAMVNIDSLIATIQSLENYGTRFMMAPNRKDIAEFLVSRFISFGIPEVRIDSFLCYTLVNSPPFIVYDTTTWQYNVEAKLTGTVWPGREIVMMAHYDNIVNDADPMYQAPGADDNASGVASLLECARIIMGTGYEPQQTLIFLVTAAEELNTVGGSGSRHYAEEAAAAGRDLSSVFNNDMIGWNDGSWTLNLIDNPGSKRITDLSAHVVDSYTSLNRAFNSIGTFCDLKYFLYEGYEGIFFLENVSNGWNPYYHTLADLLSSIDNSYLAENTRANIGCLLLSDLVKTEAALLSIGNIPEVVCMSSVEPVITLANFGSDTLNSLDIFCQINGEDVLTIPWSGNLAFRETQQIELPGIYFSVLPDNELVITLENINGIDDEVPLNNEKSTIFEMAQATSSEVKLKIKLDANPQEISWDIRNSIDEVIYSGGPYSTPNALVQEAFNFDEPGCYRFALTDAGGDGLQPGFVLLYHGSSSVILSESEFDSTLQTQFDVGGTLGTEEKKNISLLNIFPNPMMDVGYIDLQCLSDCWVEIWICNLLGQKVLKVENEFYHPGIYHLIYSTNMLASGVYYVEARIGKESITSLLIKQ